ncbi:hypothetical protein PENTCL1PPCAC_24425, partial [Pristionchus entomophagus]
MNENSLTDTTWPIVLYVVDKMEASKYTYHIYDAVMWPSKIINNGILTVMSAYPFSLTAKPSGSSNGVTARLAGFDNAEDGNTDDCPVAFDMPTSDSFDGFMLNINGPIISMLFKDAYGLQMHADLQFTSSFDLSEPGFVTSGGYNGCRKPISGGVQSFRSALIQTSDMYKLRSSTNLYNVNIDVVPNLDLNHKLSIDDYSNQEFFTIYGVNEVPMMIYRCN